MSSANYEMSTSTSVQSNEMSTLSSVYIPRVFANLSTEFVAEIFESLNLGVVDRVEAVPRSGDKNSYMAFVYFASWNSENTAAANLAKRINCPTPGASQARIVYDDPWFWILLPNKSEKSSPKKSDDDEKPERELDANERVDILTDMVEDLQERLLEREKKVERLEKELSDLRVILLSDRQKQTSTTTDFPWHLYGPVSQSEIDDIVADYPPPPPRLVRQNAVGGLGLSVVPSIPPIKRQTQAPLPINWCHNCSRDGCVCVHENKGWVQDVTDEGFPYYYNEFTGDSAWENPSDSSYMKKSGRSIPIPPLPGAIGGPRPYMRAPDASFELPNEFPDGAPTLPKKPFVVEPTHFHSKKSVAVILRTLANAFVNKHVTVEKFSSDKCRFGCSYYYGLDKTEFVVRVFDTETENNLIEFQRRWGNREGFYHIYDSVASEISDIIDLSVPRSSHSFHQYIPRIIRNQNPDSTTQQTLPEQEWPSEEEVADYREDRRQRRMEEAGITQVRVDGMGLVYPKNDTSDNFWCDP